MNGNEMKLMNGTRQCRKEGMNNLEKIEWMTESSMNEWLEIGKLKFELIMNEMNYWWKLMAEGCKINPIKSNQAAIRSIPFERLVFVWLID